MHRPKPLRSSMHPPEQIWDYSPLNGPTSWPKHFLDAAGERQSPINIDISTTEFDPSLQNNALTITYPDTSKYKLINKGMSVAMSPTFSNTTPFITGGPLRYKYQFDHFHFHWGGTNERGSEHTVDGRSFAAELHFVHWNSQKFVNMATAASSDEGLAVIGVFLQVGEENIALKQMTDSLSRIKYRNDSLDVHSFSPKSIMPQNFEDYWTYSGSLTTPPCYESVTWIVLKEPITISVYQLQQFRQTKSFPFYESPQHNNLHSPYCIMDNFRPPQPLNDRVVRSSFK